MKQFGILTTLLLLLGMLSGQASAGRADIDFGLKGGLNMSRFVGDDVHRILGAQDVSHLFGFVGGGFVRSQLTDKLAVQIEVLYSRRGSKFTAEFPGDTLEIYHIFVRTNSIEMPILLHVQLPVGGGINPYLLAGPYFAYGLSAQLEFRRTQISDGITLEDDVQLSAPDIYNIGDFLTGLNFGAGIGKNLGKYSIAVEARYSVGLSKTFSDVPDRDDVPEGEEALADYPDGDAFKLRYSTFSFMLQFGF